MTLGDDFDKDRVKEKDLKDFMKNHNEWLENTKDRCIDINLEVTLIENIMITKLLQEIRQKKKWFGK